MYHYEKGGFMKKNLFSLLCLFSLLLIPLNSFAGMNFIAGLNPGVFLYSPDADGHRVSDGRISEEIDGYISNIATLNAGIGWEAPQYFLDLTGNIGYLYNSSFTGMVYGGDIALRLKLPSEVMTLGPHVGIMAYDMDWDGETDVSLSDTTGFVAGLCFTAGTKPFSFAASLDYFDASFDVESGNNAVRNEELDISGIVLQLGVIFRF